MLPSKLAGLDTAHRGASLLDNQGSLLQKALDGAARKLDAAVCRDEQGAAACVRIELGQRILQPLLVELDFDDE
ncbi:hypothetical protein D3C75_1249030 [compost metagenome]